MNTVRAPEVIKLAHHLQITQPRAVSVDRVPEKSEPRKGMTMDALDVRIIKRLENPVALCSSQTGARRTLLTIARELKVDETTVRNRFDRMRREGFLRQLTVNISPAALGLTDCHLRIQVSPPDKKKDAMEEIKLLSGVYLIRNYSDGFLGIDFHSENDHSLPKKIELIRKIANSDKASLVIIAHPRCDYRFSETDLKIIEYIHESPFESYVSIARGTGLSAKTVRRRFREMLSARAIFIALSLECRVLRGVIKGDLLLVYEDAGSKEKVDAEVKEILDRRIPDLYIIRPGNELYTLTLPNLWERTETLRDVKSLNNVKAAYIDLVEERDEQYDTFREEIEKKMLQVKALRPVQLR